MIYVGFRIKLVLEGPERLLNIMNDAERKSYFFVKKWVEVIMKKKFYMKFAVHKYHIHPNIH